MQKMPTSETTTILFNGCLLPIRAIPISKFKTFQETSLKLRQYLSNLNSVREPPNEKRAETNFLLPNFQTPFQFEVCRFDSAKPQRVSFWLTEKKRGCLEVSSDAPKSSISASISGYETCARHMHEVRQDIMTMAN